LLVWQVRIDFDPAFSSTREMGHVEASLSRDAASRLGIEVDTTARAFQNESIHLEVHVAGGGAADCVRGEVWLPVTKVYTPSLGATTATFAEFSEVLWRHGQRVGRLSGVVSVLNGPRVVQLRSGFYTERGIVPLGPIALDGWATDELADAVADAAGPTPRVPTGDAAAAGAAGCAAAASGVARTLSSDWTDVGAYPARAYSGGVGGMANAKAASLPQFEHPPKGLELPKQVDALLSLVQNLHEVILDLHIDQVRRDPAKIHPAKISRAEANPREIPMRPLTRPAGDRDEARRIAHGRVAVPTRRRATRTHPEQPRHRPGDRWGPRCRPRFRSWSAEVWLRWGASLEFGRRVARVLLDRLELRRYALLLSKEHARVRDGVNRVAPPALLPNRVR